MHKTNYTKQTGWEWICLLGVLGVANPVEAAGLGDRVANTSLKMPGNPPSYGYTTTDAFPGLTFQSANGVVSPPGETNRLFVLEDSGRIQVITNLIQPTKTLFLDISSRVNASSEGGLLGLAFHPGYRTNRLFFVFYTLNTATTAGSGLHDRLSRFEISATNTNAALPNSEVPLITQYDQEFNHNGGDIHFGPDGYLYVSLGDEGSAGDARDNSQRIDKDFFSSILRLDVDHHLGNPLPNSHPASSTNYAIPLDNPFVGATNFYNAPVNPLQVRTEFWAIGMRNPWRMSFDPETGLLYCGDVGQGTREEIDIIKRGANYGWNVWEGKYRVYGTPPPGAVFAEPILDYERSGNPPFNGACVIGGIVYRGLKYADLYGRYVFGDWTSGNIWALRYDGQSVTEWRQLLTTSAGIAAFGRDPSNGDVLFVNNTTGRLLRLIQDPGQPMVLPPLLSDTGAFSDLATLTPNPGIVPYTINTPFWSDHAFKTRWFSVPNPNLTIGFDPIANWSFPTGTVWIKHFDLELTNGVASSAKRIETRLLVRQQDGVYGVTYRWGDSLTNATLVPDSGMDETFVIDDGGTPRTQIWHYPGRVECLLCHTPQGGFAGGFNTAQLNSDFSYDGGVENQLAALSRVGYLNPTVPDPQSLPRMAHATNTAFSLEHRARSYLAANCAHCHQPGGTAQGLWDARFSTLLPQAGIINGALLNNYGDAQNRVVWPGSFDRSILRRRIAEFGSGHMPPLGTSELNHEGISLLSEWILSIQRPSAPRNLRLTPN